MPCSLLAPLFLAILSLAAATDPTSTPTVSYGSSIKLEHVASTHRLHSHDIPYGTGSQQQSVTAYPDGSDINSYWVVKSAHKTPHAPSGKPVSCGDTVRLQHLATGKNLHSHEHRAPMTSDYEVSAYREDDSAGGRWFDGDSGDDWVITCDGMWKRGANVRMKHVDTGYWLSSSKRNGFGHPTAGQLQVCSTYRKGGDTAWKTAEGLYMHALPKKAEATK